MNGDPSVSYHMVYTESCMQENMSSLLHNIHPALRLREPKSREIQAEIASLVPPRLLIMPYNDGLDAGQRRERFF